MPELMTLYKLIILYMLNLVDFPLTNSQITEFILGKEYTNYFTIQQSLAQLSEAGLVREEPIQNRTLYHLTEDGLESIRYFKGRIPNTIQKEIAAFLEEHHYDLKSEMDITANYELNRKKEYTVYCQVSENNQPLVTLNVTAPTEDMAAKMAANWTKNNQEIYALIMEKLLS